MKMGGSCPSEKCPYGYPLWGSGQQRYMDCTHRESVLGACRKTPKKVSACAFTHDGAYAMFADRFGDVLAGPTNCASIEGLDPHVAQSPATMLGHFCAIITSLTLSPDGK